MVSAARAFEQVHARWATSFGRDHARTLTALNNLGAVRREQGRYVEAEHILRDVYAKILTTSEVLDRVHALNGRVAVAH